MRLKKAILSIIILLSLSNCEEDLGPCSAVSPKSPTITFTIIDSLTGKSLIGPDRLYNLDTITKLNSQPYDFIYGYSDSILIYDFENSRSGENQPFRLSRTEYDTVKVEFEVVEGQCFTSKNLTQFYYNGEPLNSQDYIIQIKK